LLTSDRHNPGNNLHVSGLSHKIETRDLEAAFAKIGRVRLSSIDILREGLTDTPPQVKKASVMYDPHTRESRGFGFVTVRLLPSFSMS
jgi:RNA recognition motif-containing protein